MLTRQERDHETLPTKPPAAGGAMDKILRYLLCHCNRMRVGYG